MKTIDRYVFSTFFSSFLLAFLVLSFVLTIGLLVQIVGYILDEIEAHGDRERNRHPYRGLLAVRAYSERNSHENETQGRHRENETF